MARRVTLVGWHRERGVSGGIGFLNVARLYQQLFDIVGQVLYIAREGPTSGSAIELFIAHGSCPKIAPVESHGRYHILKWRRSQVQLSTGSS
jgi:hypothetical protein